MPQKIYQEEIHNGCSCYRTCLHSLKSKNVFKPSTEKVIKIYIFIWKYFNTTKIQKDTHTKIQVTSVYKTMISPKNYFG